jgi:hypothetical protein
MILPTLGKIITETTPIIEMTKANSTRENPDFDDKSCNRYT